MSRSSEPSERAQHSVAELLARYGEVAPPSGRRRRRALEDDDSGPRSIIERVRTDDVPMPVADRLSTQPDLGERDPESFGSRDWMDADLGRGWDDRGSRTYLGTYGTEPGLHEDNWMGLPPVGPGPEPLNGRALSSGPSTDQFPRLDPMPPRYPVPQHHVPQHHVPQRPVSAPPVDRQPRSGASAAGLSTANWPVPQQGWRVDEAPAPASEDTALNYPALDDAPLGQAAGNALLPDRSDVPSAVDSRDAEPRVAESSVAEFDAEELCADESSSPVREWVVMVTQIGVGVVGGAALWLICEWLWQRIPVVALVVALAVITGLVWVVRRVRRTEDLQTTVIAVLVGLFVTVSPAALLLVGR